MAITLGRRRFVAFIGGAAAWPVMVRAQQAAIPVLGVLGSSTFQMSFLAAFLDGLKGAGYIEGRNLTIEYLSAQGQYDRLPALASGLVRREVSLIFAMGGAVSVLAAKTATTTIPIVFVDGSDPVKDGIVASLSRPDGNITGVTFFANVLAAKRVGLLHDLVPDASSILVMINPVNLNADIDLGEVEIAARQLGLQVQVLKASTESDLDRAFAGLTRQRSGVLWVSADAFFVSRRVQIVALAARRAIPAIYARREYVEDGGLVSYGTDAIDSYHQGGLYAGQILKGERPANLPVQQPTKFELVINLKTAKALGLAIPPNVLAIAHEVIE